MAYEPKRVISGGFGGAAAAGFAAGAPGLAAGAPGVPGRAAAAGLLLKIVLAI